MDKEMTGIQLPTDHPLVDRLKQIVEADDRLELRVFYQFRNAHVHDPYLDGWGAIGDRTYYRLFADWTVKGNEILEIAAALGEEKI